MTTKYPAALDTTADLGKPNGSDPLNAPDHAGIHNNITDAIIAVQTALGQNLDGIKAMLPSPPATGWTAAAYPQGSVVSYNGSTWVATSAATAGDVPGVAALWKSISNEAISTELATLAAYVNKLAVGDTASVPAWTAAAYNAGDVVVHDNAFWTATSAATAGDVPGVAAQWASISNLGLQAALSSAVSSLLNGGNAIAPWAAGPYPAGSVVAHLGKFWYASNPVILTDVPGTSTEWRELTLVNASASQGVTNERDGAIIKFWRGTAAQYAAIVAPAADTEYIITP